MLGETTGWVSDILASIGRSYEELYNARTCVGIGQQTTCRDSIGLLLVSKK